MNFKQLVNDFLVETQMDDPVATVLGQTDDAAQAVQWVSDAWTQVQRAERWDFLWNRAYFTTTAGKSEYTPIEQNRGVGSKIDITTFRNGNNGTHLAPMDYHRLAVPSRSGSPSMVALLPNDSVVFNATPTEPATYYYEYWATPAVLTDDLDTPTAPAQFHKAIVWLAVTNYAREQGAEWNGLYTAATRDFNAVYSDMQRFYLPQMLPKVPLIY